MGDLRHKKSPPANEVEEDNTPEFRAEARAALANNAIANRIRKKKKGDPGYLISNQAELADAIDADRTTIKKLLGSGFGRRYREGVGTWPTRRRRRRDGAKPRRRNG